MIEAFLNVLKFILAYWIVESYRDPRDLLQIWRVEVLSERVDWTIIRESV
jgi:hypothetical protein